MSVRRVIPLAAMLFVVLQCTRAVTGVQVPVASVTVAPLSIGLTVGLTGQLTATLRDSAGTTLTGRTVSWTTNAGGVATVNSSGLVTAVAAGTATITATSEGKSGSATVTVTTTAAPVATVIVTPPTVNLTVGATQQLAVTVQDASGAALVGRTVTWTTTAGSVATVNTTGRVTAQAVGSAMIIASCEGKADTSNATVTQVPVATVVVTPAIVNLTVAGTQQMTVVLRDAANNVLTGRTVSWSTTAAGVATVNTTGLVTAQAVGTASVIATSEGKADTAAVTVTASGGGQTLLSESFDDQSFAARGWYDNTGAQISTVEKRTGAAALEMRWTQGANGAVGLGTAMRHLFTGTTTLYLSYWVKYSTNYVGTGTNLSPHEFGFVSDRDEPAGNLTFSYMYAYIEQVYQNGGIPLLRLQDARMIDSNNINVDLTGVSENRAVSGCNGNQDGTPVISCFRLNGPWYNGKEWKAAAVAFRPSPGTDYKSDWNHVEVYFQLNTVNGGVAQANGIARYWLNGNLKIEKTNVVFRTGANSNIKFNQFLITPYMGSGSPVAQTMWVDDLLIATAHP